MKLWKVFERDVRRNSRKLKKYCNIFSHTKLFNFLAIALIICSIVTLIQANLSVQSLLQSLDHQNPVAFMHSYIVPIFSIQNHLMLHFFPAHIQMFFKILTRSISFFLYVMSYWHTNIITLKILEQNVSIYDIISWKRCFKNCPGKFFTFYSGNAIIWNTCLIWLK